MGKIRQKKKESVFKVAGAKSLKAKKKAKPVTGNFKKNSTRPAASNPHIGQIKETVRKNIDQIDKTLVNFENDLRQKKKKEEKVKPSGSKQEKKPAIDFEKEKDKTLEKLNEMQF